MSSERRGTIGGVPGVLRSVGWVVPDWVEIPGGSGGSVERISTDSPAETEVSAETSGVGWAALSETTDWGRAASGEGVGVPGGVVGGRDAAAGI